MTGRVRRAGAAWAVGIGLVVFVGTMSGMQSGTTSGATVDDTTLLAGSAPVPMDLPGTSVVGALPPPRITIGARPLVIATAGNSILFDVEPALAAALQATGVAELRPHTIGGFGITVLPEVWQNVFSHDVVGIDDADYVVVMLGNRDLSSLSADPVGYRQLLDESVTRLTARGAGVLWLGLPPLPSTDQDETARRELNTMLAELPERFPGKVLYVSTDPALGGPGDRYQRMAIDPTGENLPSPLRKQRPDGTPDEHLCPVGAIRITKLVLDQLELAGLPAPAPSSWLGQPWSSDPRYDDPPGGCLPG